MRKISDVPRIDALDKQKFLAEYVTQQRPVIISGEVQAWPALTRWTASYLATTFPTQVFHFKSSTSEAHPDFRRSTLAEMFARKALTFAEFGAQVCAGPAAQRSQLLFSGDEHFLFRVREGVATLNPDLAPLWADVQVPALFPQAQLYSVWAWFSGRGVRTWLHYDNNGCHNLNAQLFGSKRAWLFPPSELDKLALFPFGGPNPATNCSQIDIDRPEPSRFPEFETACAYEAQLSRGDLLFIPANWLHTFAHDGDWNANVNFWWKPEEPLTDPVAERERRGKQSPGY